MHVSMKIFWYVLHCNSLTFHSTVCIYYDSNHYSSVKYIIFSRYIKYGYNILKNMALTSIYIVHIYINMFTR
jgi:hypothetical protein